MRATLEIRDDLMRSLLARHPDIPTRRAVEYAIEAYLSHGAAAGVRALAGRVGVEDASSTLRRHDCRS